MGYLTNNGIMRFRDAATKTYVEHTLSDMGRIIIDLKRDVLEYSCSCSLSNYGPDDILKDISEALQLPVTTAFTYVEPWMRDKTRYWLLKECCVLFVDEDERPTIDITWELYNV